MDELFENIDDISEPSMMETIFVRLEEIQAEDEEFMQLLLSKQHEMIITWEQPWYQQINGLTRPLSMTNCKDLMDNETDTFRTDTICYDESKMIHKNWKKFQKIFGVPNTPICLARWRNKEKCRYPTTPEEFVRRFVISFLAQGLQRNLYQVYKHFVTRYGSPNKGKYSKNEEKVMEVCVNHCPKNAVRYLSAVLSREPRGIYKRLWQIFNGKPERMKLKWTLPLATKLLKLIMQHTGETDVEKLKQKQFDKTVWLNVGNDMDHFYAYVKQFWHDVLHVQLFIKKDVKINRLRRKVFKVLKLYPYKVWTDIRWKEVAKHFPEGFSHGFLFRTCKTLVQHTLPGYLKYKLQDIINHGITRSKIIRNRRLRTLILNENQELEIIKYETKLEF